MEEKNEKTIASHSTKRGRQASRYYNHQIADAFCNAEMFARNLVYFVNYDSFFIYTDNKYYKKLGQRELDKIVLRFCEVNFPSQGYTKQILRDVVEIIKMKVLREAEQEDSHYIAFNDCLLNTRTFELEPADISKFVTHYIPVDYTETSADCPVFKNFLKTSLPLRGDKDTPDQELIDLVQEMMGFYLLDTAYATGAFFLYGAGSNGKGILSDVVRDMIGADYCSALSLSQLSQQFEIVSLINKRVNISAEEDEKFASSKIFKAVVTGDYLHGRHIYGTGFDFKPKCKFLYSTNKLPTFDGLDYGLKRRIFIIPFWRKFLPHEQDKLLKDKLKAELPAIVGFAIEGAKRLTENDFVFSKSSASGDVFKEFEEEMSSALMFFNENYVLDTTNTIAKTVVYDNYLAWMDRNRKRGILSKRRFFRELEDNMTKLETQRCYYNGSTQSCYVIKTFEEDQQSMLSLEEAAELNENLKVLL